MTSNENSESSKTSKSYYKKWYENNKERLSIKLNEKKDCACGGRYTIVNEKTHFKSGRHKNYENSKETNDTNNTNNTNDTNDKKDIDNINVITNNDIKKNKLVLPDDDELIPFFVSHINSKKPTEHNNDEHEKIKSIINVLNNISELHENVLNLIKDFFK
jgi:hypothetical protein